MTYTTKPGDPADKAADGAFGGVTSHRAGYGDRLARVEEWLRKHPSATLASGEGAALLAEIDWLREELATAHAAIDRVWRQHAPQEYTIWSGARLQRCTHCRDESGYCLPYPCPTLRALDGGDVLSALDGEGA
jgi:hypothetical protein